MKSRQVASSADPEPADSTIKRLAQVVDRLSTLAETITPAAFPQGP